jgi:anaphase-promoting complex subunit 10
MYSPSDETLEAMADGAGSPSEQSFGDDNVDDLEADDAAAESGEEEEDGDGSHEEEEEDEEEGAQEGDEGTTAATAAGFAVSDTILAAVPDLNSLYSKNLRSVEHTAICWQLSSAKPGNGVEQLREANVETYWQSDGVSQPHSIQLSFHRRLPITHVDYSLDESYTPKSVLIETGMTSQDLSSAVGGPSNHKLELNEPVGWVIFPLATRYGTSNSVSKVHVLRVSILSMHQNGRDTHVRRLAVFAERSSTASLLPSTAHNSPWGMSSSFSMTASREEDRDGIVDPAGSEKDEEEEMQDVTLWNPILSSSQGATFGGFSTTIR